MLPKDMMRRGLVVLAALLVTIGGIAAIEHVIENLGPRGGRLLECLLVFLLIACVAWASRGWLRNAAVTACSLAFGLVAIQAVLLVMAPKGPARKAGVDDEHLVASRDVFGWGARHPGVFHTVKTAPDGRIVFDVHATIDANLRRKTDPSNGAHPMPFFGDSFIFGDGVNDDETLPQAFADLNQRKFPVLNLGFSGWAPSQNLAELQTEPYRSQLRAPRRMILFTALFHVERTACKAAFAWGSGPRYVLDGDTVRRAGTCVGSAPKFVNAIRQFIHGFNTRLAPATEKLDARDVETYIKIIESFAATARREYGVGTTVLMEPGGDQYLAGTGYDQAKIVGALRAAGVDVLMKTDPPDGEERLYRIEGDGHPTGLANQATARQLEAHLRVVDPHALD